MLEGIRAAQSTWIGKTLMTLVFGLIVLAFVVWGIGDVFRGGGGNQIAQVGGVSITTTAYRQAYQTELQNLQQRARRQITNDEAHRLGLDVQVLSRLMSDAALDDRAMTLGLGISDGRVVKSILTDPSFAGPGGGFDRARFEAVLRDNGFTEQSFIRDQRQTDLRQEFVQALIGGMTVPAAAVDALHRYEAETRSLDYVVLPPSAAGEIAEPDAAALGAYYDAHKSAFTAPQYRKLVVLAVTPATLAKPETVSDADATALYEKVKDARYGTPETRTVQQIVFPSEGDAETAAVRIRAGTPFGDIVKERKLDEKSVDLGTVTKGQIFDHAVADAAFGLPVGGTTDPVKGTFGSVLVHVTAVRPANLKPFTDVEPALKTEIATGRAEADAKALRDRIEDARTSGRTLAEAAGAVGLQARTIDAIDAAGLDKSGAPVTDLADGKDLLKAAFASDVGVDNDTISTADGGTVWFEVAAVDPARQRTLDEAKPEVEAAWREEETAKRIDGKAADLVKAIDAGQQTLEQAAQALGDLAVTHIGDAKRAGAAGLDNSAVARIFDVPVGSAGTAAASGASRTLFKVLDSTVPPLNQESPETKQIAERYRVSLQDSLINAYLGKLGSRLGTKVNQEALKASSGNLY